MPTIERTDEQKEIERGCIVQLRSGGPKMTVENVQNNPADQVQCLWFARDERGEWGELKRAVFQTHVLEVVKTARIVRATNVPPPLPPPSEGPPFDP